jgi:hypothetical protein
LDQQGRTCTARLPVFTVSTSPVLVLQNSQAASGE